MPVPPESLPHGRLSYVLLHRIHIYSRLSPLPLLHLLRQKPHNLFIIFRLVREGAIRAVFDFLSAFTRDKVRIARTVFVLIQWAVTKEAVKICLFFHFMTRKVFTFFIFKITVTVFHAFSSIIILIPEHCNGQFPYHDIFNLLSSHEIIIPQYGVKLRSCTKLSYVRSNSRINAS